MVWDISINAIDPKLIKSLMPQTIGLTSRRQDKDTGDLTVEGNMKLNALQKNTAYDLHNRENKMKNDRWGWRKKSRKV